VSGPACPSGCRPHRLARSYTDYFKLLSSGKADAEVQTAVDLLTTNETYFFREPKHFELLRSAATAAAGQAQPFRVWSAASSTGEECLQHRHGAGRLPGRRPWEVVGSDISTRVLQRARFGHYPMERTKHIPQAT
jgi:chemotaxis protein methyltransferase CheR